METRGIMGFIFKISDWIMKLAYINILWILFSIFGLLIFGFFPATISMFSIIRKWILGIDKEFPVFKTFYQTFKQEFIKSNLLGLLVMAVMILFFLELDFIEQYENDFLQMFYFPLFILRYIFYITILFIFSTYVHYNLKFFQLLKNSFLIMVISPISVIIIILSGIIIYLFTRYMPISILFLSGSLFVLVIMWSALSAFENIEKKQDKLVAND